MLLAEEHGINGWRQHAHLLKKGKQLNRQINRIASKPGVKQSVVQQSEADEVFLAAQQNHLGVEAAIGALQSGNAMKRCRDRSEVGFERYLQLAHLGRNLHTLGRLLIAQENEDAAAGDSRRKVASAKSHQQTALDHGDGLR